MFVSECFPRRLRRQHPPAPLVGHTLHRLTCFLHHCVRIHHGSRCIARVGLSSPLVVSFSPLLVTWRGVAAPFPTWVHATREVEYERGNIMTLFVLPICVIAYRLLDLQRLVMSSFLLLCPCPLICCCSLPKPRVAHTHHLSLLFLRHLCW
jgi:hypothetical protein